MVFWGKMDFLPTTIDFPLVYNFRSIIKTVARFPKQGISLFPATNKINCVELIPPFPGPKGLCLPRHNLRPSSHIFAYLAQEPQAILSNRVYWPVGLNLIF